MPQTTKPQVVITETRQGEVTIRLVIDLNLNLNGQVAAVASSTEVSAEMTPKTEDKAEWLVPDFSPPTEKIEFGKYEK